MVMQTADEIRAQIAELEKSLAKAEEAEARAAQAGSAKRAIALLAAAREAVRELEKIAPGVFSDEKWTALSWPRATRFKRMADLSETEVKNAQDAGQKAVRAL